MGRRMGALRPAGGGAVADWCSPPIIRRRCATTSEVADYVTAVRALGPECARDARGLNAEKLIPDIRERLRKRRGARIADAAPV